MTTIRRILCPVDFSECSRHAFDRAVAVARGEHAALEVLHVPLAAGSDLERVRREMQQFLDVDESLDVRVTLTACDTGPVDEEILSHARNLPADLIVMGTHGRSGVQRLMLGSVAERVLRRAEPPVLTVPPLSAEAASPSRAPFRRILCAVDFSQWSLAGLNYAVSLAQRHDARLAVFHVIELIAPTYDPIAGPLYDPLVPEAVQPGSLSAAEIVTRARLRGLLPPEIRETIAIDELVARGKAHHEIVELAAAWKGDLIVMGTNGRNMIDRALFGSTVEPVVRRAPCPVLTVRPGNERASAAA